MLTRRHIRAKVMQSIYAFVQSGKEDVNREQKNMLVNIEKIYDLYVLMLNLIIDVVNLEQERVASRNKKRKEMGGSETDVITSYLSGNKFVEKLANNKALQKYTEDNSLSWNDKDEYLSILLKEIKESEYFRKYIHRDNWAFNTDKNFIIDVFKEVIAPNEKVHEFLESESLAWLGDMQVANSMVVKTLTHVFEDSDDNEKLLSLFKDEDDIQFAKDLYRFTIKESSKYESIIAEKTPDWDRERIASLDLILMEMAIAEFLNFNSIPTKVSINEYLEISKDFSTPKSRIFINGVLDKVWRDLDYKGLIKKQGRGLV